jgi:rRNA maturation endonuclease Nob1
MTVIVILGIVVCLAVGLAVIVWAIGSKTAGRDKKMCTRCRNANPEHAKFCAHCGQKLDA